VKTELVKIDTLVFDPANARKHDEKNLGAIRSSLQRFGQQKPIVVDANGVVRAGNGTLAAAKSLGWKEISIVRSPLSGSEATAYAIADNRSSELAEWDDDVLSQTLAALQIEDEDLALATGFDAKEIDALLAPDEVTENEVPDAPVDPITKTGDLWILGDHRLLCGDSTKSEDVERLMNGERKTNLITDPPFGVDWRGHSASTLKWQGFANDKGELDLSKIFSQFDNVVAFGANCFPQHLPHRGRWIVWDKRVDENADRMLGSPFELAWTSKTSGFDRIYRVQHGGVVNADGANERRVHPTQKPIRLLRSIVEDYSEGAIVDLFLGSGTTLLAAEMLGRKCYGMEISPAFCDVIVSRWEKLTGRKAERGSTATRT
jgi:ParB-like chromosome segregation protein Spo0J